ncbi:hypothetical protein Hanom_Chr00s045156g01776321 [Helianthus anomalus]
MRMMTRAMKMTGVLMTTSYDVNGGNVWISDSHTLPVWSSSVQQSRVWKLSASGPDSLWVYTVQNSGSV